MSTSWSTESTFLFGEVGRKRAACCSLLLTMAAVFLGGYELEHKHLECPANWESDYLSEEGCDDTADKLCLSPSAWTDVLERFKLAWSFWELSKKDKAREYLVECYMRLLPDPVFHKDCGLVGDYRPALRLVLDSTWAMMRVECVVDQHDAVNLNKFVASVQPLSKLDEKQRAAVYAIRGCLAPDQDRQRWLRKSIKLSPGEGQWGYYLGWMLQEDRHGKKTPSKEELRLLRNAYKLRKDPDSILRLARSLIECGPSRLAEAEALVEEALTLYPDHPRALTNGANLLARLRENSPAVLRRMHHLYKRAQTIVGDRAFIHLKLAALCFMSGMKEEGDEHLNFAFDLNPSVCKIFVENTGMPIRLD
ncbi:uncharacterized protein LOC117645465 isoform X6 [Thrips palmi]|uniref:Uncharacterized protein LOC117645465 isoform X6 n=1 Tax=Thrips palmi TaxID=161013 RepID=A0A6P8YNP4_THRPL|nr:uncharacterized protein LOC117645465 isoform X6 [Thrips palmi]